MIKECLHQNGYKLLESIGKGAYSECYKVYSYQYKQLFACKVIRTQNMHEQAESFENEFKALSTLTHSNIIHIYDTFSTNSHIFLILEFCLNGDLYDIVQTKGPFMSHTLHGYIGQILDALCYLEIHNITHKDIKPSNIFLDVHKRIKLADFGLSQKVMDDDLLSTDFAGSLGYMSPEVYNRQVHNPMRADIWSFGITLYYIATGQLPYSSPGINGVLEFFEKGLQEKHLEKVDNVTATLLKNSLVIDPSKRLSFKSLNELFHSITSPVRSIKPCSHFRVLSKQLSNTRLITKPNLNSALQTKPRPLFSSQYGLMRLRSYPTCQ